MTIQYSTLLTKGFFDTVVAALKIGGSPSLSILDASNVELAVLTFPEPLELSRTESSVLLANPLPEMVLNDGEAVSGTIKDGAGLVVVTFDVGSPTTNPEAALIISSTSLYSGGMITINKVELTI